MKEFLKSKLKKVSTITELQLNKILSNYRENTDYTKELSSVIDSAEYSLLAGGKRLRPFLVHTFCKLCGGNEENAVSPACALEMIHTYSLIHDDLPCMDNDDFRRNKPTNHKVFGEATAVLAGDALLTEAFGVVCMCSLPDKAKLQIIEVLSHNAGILGMIGGQEIDLKSEGKNISEETLRILQKKKTGMLFEAACLIGCISSCNYSESQLRAASEFAFSLGLAFQISDDILDVIGNPDELGKNTGSDEKCGKCTFTTLLGLDGAKAEAKKQAEIAKNCIKNSFDGDTTKVLIELCDYVIERRN